ncbi:multidrug effflux MFS transporter [Pseudooceanicola aestuarii]|uniref:multidrug effflux MFS transporter n=1 Tax=Pseudooceanicola aestuarii TaxID=2697319 RepID=UPI0013D27B39|nr:multidrug effflux MFS transporter [Pseudooceanicola aestuarii]
MFRLALILGLMSLTSPAAIDMYLPALPDLARDFGATEAAVQATLSSYFLAFGLAQVIYGPMADAMGRKAPLMLGMGIFLIGSVGALLSGTLGALIAWRFVQGLGGAALMAVPRAVIRDRYTGAEATRLMAMIMLVISVSPMLAPLAGSLVLAFAEWRAIFGVLVALAVLSLGLTAFVLPETLTPQKRRPFSLAAMGRGVRRLVTDPMFMGLTFIGGFGMASFFVFLATATFVYTKSYGMTPTGFSIAFALNAVGFFSASQMAGPLGARFGITRLVRLGVTGFFVSELVLLTLVLSGVGGMYVVIPGLFIGNAFLGLVIPTTMVLALDDHGDLAGLAASLGGTMQMVAGGVMIGLVGPFTDGSEAPMVAAIAMCATISFVLMLLTFRRRIVTA